MSDVESEDFEETGEEETTEEAEETSLELIGEIEGEELTTFAKSSAEATESALSEADHQALESFSGMRRFWSESSSNSDMEFDDAGSEAESESELGTAKKTSSETDSEHRRLGADQKKLMILRMKFWAMIGIPTATLAGVLTGLVYTIVKENKDNLELPPAVPDDLKDLLKEKIKEWRSLSLADLFDKVAKYVKGFELGPQAQAYMMSQLKVIVPQPPGLAGWNPAEFNAKITALVEGYAVAEAPKSLSLYSNVVAMTRPDELDKNRTRPLTVHEAADLCDHALCQIIQLKGSK